MKRLLFISLLLVIAAFVSCTKKDLPENRVFSIEDLANKKVGVIKGTTAEAYAADFGGDTAKMKLEQFTTLAEMVDALLQGSVDAVLSDDVPAKVVVNKDASLRILDEPFKEESYAGVIAKGRLGLLDSVNLALIQMRAMGVYDSIFESYVGGGNHYHVKPGPVHGEVLRVATCAKFPPFVFYNDQNKISGIDVEIAHYIADHLERPVEFINMAFGEIIESVRLGKADLGFSAFSVSEERKKIIDFTDNYATSRIIVIVRSGKEKPVFQRFKEMLFGM